MSVTYILYKIKQLEEPRAEEVKAVATMSQFDKTRADACIKTHELSARVG